MTLMIVDFATKTDVMALDAKITETKSELIKWMVSLVMGLFFAQAGLMVTLVRLVH